MSKLSIVHIAESVAALLIAVVLYFQYQDSRANREEMKAALAQQQVIIAQTQLQTKQLETGIASRDQAAQTQLAALQSQIANIQSPSQIVPWLASTLNKSTPVPITITTPVQPANGSAPAPVTASIPQEDLVSIRNLISNAQDNQIKLTACTSDRTDLQAVVAQKDSQIKSTQVELAAAVKAAKGGSAFKRTVRVFKYVGIGIGVGVVLGATHAL